MFVISVGTGRSALLGLPDFYCYSIVWVVIHLVVDIHLHSINLILWAVRGFVSLFFGFLIFIKWVVRVHFGAHSDHGLLCS
jgi:hypothetical protein